MRVSLNQIKQYIDFELPAVDELVETINSQLGGVKEVIRFGTRYDGAVIVRVVSCQKHSNADKLNVCQVDDGRGDLIQVVCGAPNVRTGMYAVWLKPGATVPSTADDKEPFLLSARELRGEMSNGMLASPKELGLGDSHDGILEIVEGEPTVSGEPVTAGASFATLFGLDDTIIDIENKMFTHRPDLFGQLGVAREIAGIQANAFTSPEWYATPSVATPAVAADTLPIAVSNDAGNNSPRFMVQVMKNATVKTSPLWLQCALVAMGGKPINNIVDLTNYMMLLTAQPTHAYDYDKLRGASIGTRMAKDGETITLLNGKSYTLESSDIVVVDGEGPIGLAGIMGGGMSEVSSDTKNIVIEVANFDMYTLRRSSMRHGVFTDALTRFNKGQSPYQNPAILRKLTEYVSDLAGAQVASETFDTGDGFDRGFESSTHLESGNVTTSFINERLGTELGAETIASLLRNVEFDIGLDESRIDYRAPFWRTDIVEAEDIVEEVGRLYGFDKLPRELPKRSSNPARRNTRRELKHDLRTILSRAGANEVLTYSFVHEKLLKKSGQDPVHAYGLSNALSPDLQYYRLSLTPSLLDKIRMNYRAGFDKFALFELGKSHFKGEMDANDPSVPNEDEHLAFVIAGDGAKGSSAYYAARRYFEQAVDSKRCTIVPLTTVDSGDEWGAQLCAPYHSDRSVAVIKDGQIYGVIGEFSEQAKSAFKLPEYSAGFEVLLDAVTLPVNKYKPLSRFPGTTKDISIKVHLSKSYSEILETVESKLHDLDDTFHSGVSALSIYQPEGATDKTITVRVSLVNSERTLTDEQINAIMKTIAGACMDAHQAEIV